MMRSRRRGQRHRTIGQWGRWEEGCCRRRERVAGEEGEGHPRGSGSLKPTTRLDNLLGPLMIATAKV